MLRNFRGAGNTFLEKHFGESEKSPPMAARWVLVGRMMQTTRLLLKSWSSCRRITGVIRPSLKVHGVGDDRFELD